MTILQNLNPITSKFCNLVSLYSLLVAMVILVVTKELVSDLSFLFLYMYTTLRIMLLLWQHACISNKNNEHCEEYKKTCIYPVECTLLWLWVIMLPQLGDICIIVVKNNHNKEHFPSYYCFISTNYCQFEAWEATYTQCWLHSDDSDCAKHQGHFYKREADRWILATISFQSHFSHRHGGRRGQAGDGRKDKI